MAKPLVEAAVHQDNRAHRTGGLSQRQAARELGIGYATLKPLLDAPAGHEPILN
jgi:transposase